jgi:hypothetical protein
MLRRHFAGIKIVLRGDTEGVRDPVEECEHGCNVDRFRNLFFFPTSIAQLLHILGGRTISGFGDQFDVIQQKALRYGKAGFVQLAFKNCGYALVRSSLNTQEVSVAVQSIGTPIEVGDIAGNHLLVTAR